MRKSGALVARSSTTDGVDVVRAAFRRHDPAQRGVLPRFALDIVLTAVLLPPDAGGGGPQAFRGRRHNADLAALGELLDDATDKATGLVEYEGLLDWIFGPEEVSQLCSPRSAPVRFACHVEEEFRQQCLLAHAESLSGGAEPHGSTRAASCNAAREEAGAAAIAAKAKATEEASSRPIPLEMVPCLAAAPTSRPIDVCIVSSVSGTCALKEDEASRQLSSVMNSLTGAESKEARLRAAVSLEALGMAALPGAAGLARALSSDDCEAVRRTAAFAFRGLGAAAAADSAPALRHTLCHDESADVRRWAAEALGHFSQPPKAAEDLSRCPPSDTAHAFQPALLTAMESDNNPVVREAAVQAVASTAKTASMATAMAGLRQAAGSDSSAAVRAQAAKELFRLEGGSRR